MLLTVLVTLDNIFSLDIFSNLTLPLSFSIFLRGFQDFLAKYGAESLSAIQSVTNFIVFVSHGYPLPIPAYCERILWISSSLIILAIIDAADTAVLVRSA